MINENNLRKGISIYKKRRNWPNDFHNKFYFETSCKLNDYLADNSVNEFWEYIVDNLSLWKALRGKKGFQKRELLNRLVKDNDTLRTYIKKFRNYNKSFENYKWNDFQKFFEFAKTLKGVNSPVFASKFCHFLFPHLFIVIDNALIGINYDYEKYWKSSKNNLIKCNNIQPLQKILNLEIPNRPFQHYPYATKIVELCNFGN